MVEVSGDSRAVSNFIKLNSNVRISYDNNIIGIMDEGKKIQNGFPKYICSSIRIEALWKEI